MARPSLKLETQALWHKGFSPNLSRGVFQIRFQNASVCIYRAPAGRREEAARTLPASYNHKKGRKTEKKHLSSANGSRLPENPFSPVARKPPEPFLAIASKWYRQNTHLGGLRSQWQVRKWQYSSWTSLSRNQRQHKTKTRATVRKGKRAQFPKASQALLLALHLRKNTQNDSDISDATLALGLLISLRP